MSFKAHAVTATCAFALGAGAMAGVMQLAGTVETPPDAATLPQSPSESQSSLRVTVMKKVAPAVLHARARVWPGEDIVFSVCARGRVPAPKPCAYEADFATVSGDMAVLRDLAPASGEIAAHKLSPQFVAVRQKRDVIAGPIPAEVLRIIDGDTLQVRAEPFPGHYVVTDVRIGGIDTPEKGGRAACDAEAALAKRASSLTTQMTAGRRVTLMAVQFEKYGGRVLAEMHAGGDNIADALVAKGLARAYDGGKKSSWCR